MAKKKQAEAHIIHDNCRSCRFWRRLDDSKQQPADDVKGDCIRYPHTVIGIDDDGTPLQVLPQANALFCCGEHARVIN